MSLTYAQLEDLVEGETKDSEVDSEEIRSAIDGHRALRERLRRTFANQQPGIGLFVRVQSAVSAAGVPTPPADRDVILRLPRWGILASAAAMVLVVLSAAYLFTPNEPPIVTPAGQGKVAQAVLAHIHEETSTHPAHAGSDWSKLRGYLAEKTGITPRRVTGGQFRLVGGSRTEFMGQPAASYVLQTSGGPVTIVVMRIRPAELNFDHCREVDVSRVWACGFRQSKMVAIRSGGLTYCAIGRFDHDRLSDILRPLIDSATTRAAR